MRETVLSGTRNLPRLMPVTQRVRLSLGHDGPISSPTEAVDELRGDAQGRAAAARGEVEPRGTAPGLPAGRPRRDVGGAGDRVREQVQAGQDGGDVQPFVWRMHLSTARDSHRDSRDAERQRNVGVGA